MALKNFSLQKSDIFYSTIQYKDLIDLIDNNRTQGLIEDLKSSMNELTNVEEPNTSFISKVWGNYHTSIIYCTLIGTGLAIMAFLVTKYRKNILGLICYPIMVYFLGTVKNRDTKKGCNQIEMVITDEEHIHPLSVIPIQSPIIIHDPATAPPKYSEKQRISRGVLPLEP